MGKLMVRTAATLLFCGFTEQQVKGAKKTLLDHRYDLPVGLIESKASMIQVGDTVRVCRDATHAVQMPKGSIGKVLKIIYGMATVEFPNDRIWGIDVSDLELPLVVKGQGDCTKYVWP